MTKYIIYSKNLSNGFEEEILKEKYDELNKSKKILSEVFAKEKIYNIILMNYYEFEKELYEISLKDAKGTALEHIVNFLESKGYGVSFNLYNSANYGAPQIRERVVIIASADGSKAPYLNPTHSQNGEFDLKPWKTLKEAIEITYNEVNSDIEDNKVWSKYVVELQKNFKSFVNLEIKK